ncbi:hypothetical protein H8B15_12820 [Hymenobacter sp. BT507]|uniref:Uncharacterized protein n=1 Tax=Hymenobacter citatus TaxID=2763506 RepID=A0ABR7ML50_9BACT|nr:hypothetical protein [Hymenobacter citatus]MBC6611810.1 hypothetical protein [Hymenobacter citatus]
MIKKLTEHELSSIKRNLPQIKKQLYKDRELYHGICISIFEKWLSKDECEKIYKTNPTILAAWRSRLENVVTEFYKLTTIYLWRHKNNYRIVFYKPNDSKHLYKRCNIRNQIWSTGHSYDLLLPEYSAVYSEEFDWTNIIWYNDFEKIQPLLELVRKSGLYILP